METFGPAGFLYDFKAGVHTLCPRIRAPFQNWLSAGLAFVACDTITPPPWVVAARIVRELWDVVVLIAKFTVPAVRVRICCVNC